MKNSNFDKFGIMIDNSRNAVMKPAALKNFIDIAAKIGYDFLMLYTEDTYEIENRPYFGRFRGKYTIAELKELDSYAKSKGVELMPCIQTLAHLNAIMRWPCFEPMRDTGDILCAGDENVYNLIDDMFKTLAESFTSRTVNVGMDEAHAIGTGNFLKRFGKQDRMEILVKHLARVAEIAAKYGFSLIMWGDMFYKLSGGSETDAELDKILKDKIPSNVNIIYWDYYALDEEHYDLRMKNYLKIDKKLWFAGGIWTWTGFAPQIQFALKCTETAIKCCEKNGIKNAFVTMWGDNGGECSRFADLPAVFAAAEFARGNFDMADISKKFEKEFGIPFEDFMQLELKLPEKAGPVITDADKYMLYQDPLMGIFDSTIKDDEGKDYGVLAENLAKYAKNTEFGTVFAAYSALASALEIKSTIGKETRKAYNEGKESLESLIAKYDELILRMENFYNKYEALWMSENKAQGFDVQDIRLGGIITRCKHARARIAQYIAGEIDQIEELSEAELDIFCRDGEPKELLCYNNWGSIVTCNVL